MEHDAPDATITTLRSAMWWAFVTTTTVGYGDYTPVTQVGRAIATVVMTVGIGLIGTVSATVAAWFVTRPSEPGAESGAEPADNVSVDLTTAAGTTADSHAALLQRLDPFLFVPPNPLARLLQPELVAVAAPLERRNAVRSAGQAKVLLDVAPVLRVRRNTLDRILDRRGVSISREPLQVLLTRERAR